MIDAVLGAASASPLRLALTAGSLALAESALGVGVFLPGEAGIVALTTLASHGWLQLTVFAAVVLGASIGDHLGYLLGRRVGPRMAHWRLVARLGPQRWASAMTQLERRGTTAVFVSRLVPVLRTVMPAAAGASGLTYRRFACASVAGAMVWAGVWVGLGSLGGEIVRIGADIA